jgi:hypothetical protein
VLRKIISFPTFLHFNSILDFKDLSFTFVELPEGLAITLFKLALVKSALAKMVPYKFASSKFARYKFVFVRFAFLKLTPIKDA